MKCSSDATFFISWHGHRFKKVKTLELVTEEEIKYYFNSKYSKKKIDNYNCHARALRVFFNYLEKDRLLHNKPSVKYVIYY